MVVSRLPYKLNQISRIWTTILNKNYTRLFILNQEMFLILFSFFYFKLNSFSPMICAKRKFKVWRRKHEDSKTSDMTIPLQGVFYYAADWKSIKWGILLPFTVLWMLRAALEGRLRTWLQISIILIKINAFFIAEIIKTCPNVMNFAHFLINLVVDLHQIPFKFHIFNLELRRSLENSFEQ